MGSGDGKAELATVVPATSIVSSHRSWGGGLSEKAPCREGHFPSSWSPALILSGKPCRECTPIPRLITGDKDKSRSEEGTDEHSGGVVVVEM